MSVDYYMVCHDCRAGLHVAQDGMSGWTFYSGEPECMQALGKFLHAHQGHKLQLATEHVWYGFDPDYVEVNWEPARRSGSDATANG